MSNNKNFSKERIKRRKIRIRVLIRDQYVYTYKTIEFNFLYIPSEFDREQVLINKSNGTQYQGKMVFKYLF